MGDRTATPDQLDRRITALAETLRLAAGSARVQGTDLHPLSADTGNVLAGLADHLETAVEQLEQLAAVLTAEAGPTPDAEQEPTVQMTLTFRVSDPAVLAAYAAERYAAAWGEEMPPKPLADQVFEALIGSSTTPNNSTIGLELERHTASAE